MIKNIVFDINGVLITQDYARNQKNGYTLGNLLTSGIINSTDIWKDYNRGLYHDDREVTERLCQKLPLLKSRIIQTMDKNQYLKYTENRSMCDLLRKLRENYNVFILSNQTVADYKRLLSFEIIANTPAIVSCRVGCKKPEKAIYQALIDTYKIKPEETVFIDDLPKNIKTARQLGFKTIWHVNNQSTESQLQSIIKEK